VPNVRNYASSHHLLVRLTLEERENVVREGKEKANVPFPQGTTVPGHPATQTIKRAKALAGEKARQKVIAPTTLIRLTRLRTWNAVTAARKAIQHATVTNG
jgi:hypothetical protein